MAVGHHWVPALPEERGTVYPVQISGLLSALCLATTPSLHCFAYIPCLTQGAYKLPPEREPFQHISIVSFFPSLLAGDAEPPTQHSTLPSSAGVEQVLVHRPTTIIFTLASLAESGINVVTCSNWLPT